MKKLLIIASAVIVAASAHATNVNWSLGCIYGIGANGSGYAAGDALFAGKADVQLIIGTTLTEGVIGGEIYNGTASGVTFDEAGMATPAMVEVAMTSGASYYTQVILTSGDSILKSGIFEINNASVYGGELYPNYGSAWMCTGLEDAASETHTLTGLDTFDNNMYGAFGSAGWQSVPEPTSGLLLLLGVAGLALRRRRA